MGENKTEQRIDNDSLTHSTHFSLKIKAKCLDPIQRVRRLQGN